MSTTPTFLRSALVALLAALGIGSAPAVTLATGSYANTGIGAEFASPYDNLYITGGSVDVAFGAMPIELALADYAFEVGPNCYACSLTPSFDAILDVTLDGVTRQLDLPYAWSSTGPVDRLAFATPATLRFDYADSPSITLTVADLGTLSSSGDTVRGRIDAVLSVSAIPEPSAWALTIAGLGLVAWVKRRRTRP
jgi:hypothetical protein